MEGYKMVVLLRTWKHILLGMCTFFGVLSLQAESHSQNQDYEADFTSAAPSKGQTTNLNWSSQGLTQFRRNLQGTYLSEIIPIDLAAIQPFFTLAVKANFQNYDPALVRFEVRFSATQEDWTDWQTVAGFHEGEIDPDIFRSDMVVVERTATHFQYLIVLERATAGSSPIWIEDVDIHLFRPEVAPILPGSSMNFQFSGMDTSCVCAMPGFASRTDWGCPDGQNFSGDGLPVVMPTSHMVVHHSASSNTSNNWAAVVLAIWNLHKVNNGWDDIGYNWLIDPNGVIYEGRGGGNNVRGAHFCGTNSNTMGVCMLGTFNDVPPTQAAIESLSKLLAWKSCDSNLEPTGQEVHTASGLSLPIITGHRSGCATLCPGDSLFYLLSGTRTTVNQIVDTCAKVVAGLPDLWNESLSVHPNPAQETFYLDYQAEGRWEGDLTIHNLMGQKVFQQGIDIFPHQPALPIRPPASLQQGIYIVRLSNAEGSWTKRLYWMP